MPGFLVVGLHVRLRPRTHGGNSIVWMLTIVIGYRQFSTGSDGHAVSQAMRGSTMTEQIHVLQRWQSTRFVDTPFPVLCQPDGSRVWIDAAKGFSLFDRG